MVMKKYKKVFGLILAVSLVTVSFVGSAGAHDFGPASSGYPEGRAGQGPDRAAGELPGMDERGLIQTHLNSRYIFFRITRQFHPSSKLYSMCLPFRLTETGHAAKAARPEMHSVNYLRMYSKVI